MTILPKSAFIGLLLLSGLAAGLFTSACDPSVQTAPGTEFHDDARLQESGIRGDRRGDRRDDLLQLILED